MTRPLLIIFPTPSSISSVRHHHSAVALLRPDVRASLLIVGPLRRSSLVSSSPRWCWAICPIAGAAPDLVFSRRHGRQLRDAGAGPLIVMLFSRGSSMGRRGTFVAAPRRGRDRAEGPCQAYGHRAASVCSIFGPT